MVTAGNAVLQKSHAYEVLTDLQRTAAAWSEPPQVHTHTLTYTHTLPQVHTHSHTHTHIPAGTHTAGNHMMRVVTYVFHGVLMSWWLRRRWRKLKAPWRRSQC